MLLMKKTGNFELPNYDDVEKQLNREDMTPTKARNYLTKIVLKEASLKNNQLKGFKAQTSHAYKRGYINEAEKNAREK